jgi:two-component system, OmpR family, sensor kinase
MSAPTRSTRARGWRQLGIRPRILAWYVVLLALATGFTIALERNALINTLDQRVQSELDQEVDEFRRLLGGPAPDGRCYAARQPDGTCEVGLDPSTGEPFGSDLAAAFDTFLRRSIPGEHETMLTFLDGAFHAASIDTPAIALQEVPAVLELVGGLDEPDQRDIGTAAGPVRLQAVPVGPSDADAVFVVAQFLEPQLAQVRESARIAIIANLIVLGAASVLAYLATGRLLRPVRLVTETANTISETDLSRRIAVDGDDEISELARTFNAMLDRLEEAFASQRRFFDDAGHELRTPITIVRGNLELLPEEPEARARALTIVTAELDRMARMVQDLLTLAKSERPDFLSTEPVELHALVTDAHEMAQALAPRDWTCEARADATVDADPQRLRQAIMQLAANATDHTEPGDRISIGCDVDGSDAVLWVSDTGVGIAREDQARIFDRFSRGSNPRGEGTGLGLSIVAAIADAHGGRVVVRSDPGSGATFTLRIPRRRDPTGRHATGQP